MATNESIAFGQRLRELRVECRVSQDQLAHRTGIHPTAIGRFERGDREPRCGAFCASQKNWVSSPVGW